MNSTKPAVNQKKFSKLKPQQKGGFKKNNKKLPPLAFMIFDLTGKSLDARIIKITQLTIFENGETELKHHLFSNEGQEITTEAFSHHKIKAEDLQGKPTVSSFNFDVAKNIVVWDGQVTRNILAKNGVTKIPPLINMHSLARYLEDVPSPIRLNDYALKANPEKKNLIEFQLKKAENKIHVLPEILNHIKARYFEKHTENSAAFLVTVGKCRNKKSALEAIRIFLEKRKTFQKPKEQNENKSGKNVIVVNKDGQDIKPGKKVIVVKKASQDSKPSKKVIVVNKSEKNNKRKPM